MMRKPRRKRYLCVHDRTHRPANTPGLREMGGDIVMTRPNPFFSMCGRQALVMRKVPRALIVVIRSYRLTGVSLMSCHLQYMMFKGWVGLEVRQGPPHYFPYHGASQTSSFPAKQTHHSALALLIRKSILPNLATVAATHASIDFSSRRSHL